MQGQQVSHYRLTEKLGGGTHGDVWKGVHTQDDQLLSRSRCFMACWHPTETSSLHCRCWRPPAPRAHCGLSGVGHPRCALPGDRAEYVEGGSLEDRLLDGPHDVAMVVDLLEAMRRWSTRMVGEWCIATSSRPTFCSMTGNGCVLPTLGSRGRQMGQATKTGVIQGTLDYLAPEVFHGQSATPRADLYALALVIWEMLAGKRACPDGPLAAKMGWHIGMGLPDVRTVRQDCPDWLATLVAAMGAKNASARPESAAAALAQVRASKAGASAAAPPATRRLLRQKGRTL